MLEIQQNCDKGYECTLSILEAELGLEALKVYIQKPFLGNQSLAHSGIIYIGLLEQIIGKECKL